MHDISSSSASPQKKRQTRFNRFVWLFGTSADEQQAEPWGKVETKQAVVPRDLWLIPEVRVAAAAIVRISNRIEPSVKNIEVRNISPQLGRAIWLLMVAALGKF